MSVSVSERSSLLRSNPSEILNNYIAISSQIHVEGHIDEMKSSPVRRTFCLLVLFDLVLCVLAWIVHIQVTIGISFRSEVVDYKFNSSLFDTVVFAVLRFIFLEIIYGGVKSKLPLWIALTTAVSSGFVICKILKQYISPGDKSSINTTDVMDYITIILTFILCWVETIFLVYRMLPKEKAARQVAEYHRSLALQFADSRQSLGSNLSLHLEDDKILSPASSDDEFFSPKTTRPASPTHARLKEIQHKASDLQEKALEIIKNTLGWSYSTGDAVKGFVTYKDIVSFKGRLFKIETLLNVSAHILYNDMVKNYDHSPVWNPHVRLVKRIEHICNNVDILYNVSNEALKGYISPRDFVLLRTWAVIDNYYLISMSSIVHDDCPPQENIVRGEYGLGAILLQDSSVGNGQCRCIWLMNSDIKGKLFRSIVDRAVPDILLEIIDGLRLHCSTLMGSI